MIDVSEANVGDCVYAKITTQSSPVFGDIVKVLINENAIEIRTMHWGHRVVIAENAYWDEKSAKKGKTVKVQNNYAEWAKEYLKDEKTETIDRINSIHHGEPEESKPERKDSGIKSVSKSAKRKQKVVRKSSKVRRKTKRNRAACSRKK